MSQALRARVLVFAADLACRIGELAHARSYARTGLQMCEELDDRWGRAFASLVLGHIARETFDTAAAAALYATSLALFRETGDQVWTAWGQFDLGTIAFAQRDYTRARGLLEDSLRLLRHLGDTQGMEVTLQMIGETAHAQGDAAYAWRSLEESTELALAQGENTGDGLAVMRAVYTAWFHGDGPRATALLELELQRRRVVGDMMAAAGILHTLAWVVEDQGEHERARALAEACQKLSRDEQDERDTRLLLLLGHIANELGEYERAHRHYTESLVSYRDRELTRGSAWSLVGLARAERGDGQDPEQNRRAARLLGAAETMPDPIGFAYQLGIIERNHYDRDLTAARHGLDEESFGAAWAEGRAMTLEQAIAYALDESQS